jgi:hypothetical protein
MPTTLPRIIAVTGRAGHGKDEIGKFLGLIGFRSFAFADALKKDVLTLNPYVGLAQNGMVRLRQVIERYGWTEAKKNPEVRRLLQTYGTEVVRDNFGKDVWVNRLSASIGSARKIVITDLRFVNEARWVHDVMGGEIWRVVRPQDYDGAVMTEEAKKHSSEMEIDAIHADIEIANTGTLDDLKREALRYGNRSASENRCNHDHP